MVVTLKDIAKKIGVSDATVSMALRNHPQISRARRKQICELAKQMGYRPNPMGRALKSGKSMSIGILLGLGATSVAVHLPKLREIEKCAHANGYWPYMVSVSDPEPEAQTNLISDLLSRGLDGLIVFQTHVLSTSAVEKLSESTTPVVYLGWGPENEKHHVRLDVQTGIGQVASHLAELGHRQAYLFGTPSDIFFPGHRLGPYRQALESCGIEVVFDERLIIEPGTPTDYGAAAYQRVRSLLASGEKPTALVMTNDETTLGAMGAVMDAGLTIPGDVSVVGFDDLPYASHIRPSLTSVRQPREPMGEAAFDMLLKLMNDSQAAVEPVVFETALIARQSTGQAGADASRQTSPSQANQKNPSRTS